MSKLKYLIFFFGLLSLALKAHAQRPAYESLSKTEQILKVLADSITKGSTDMARNGALAEFNARFLDLLADPLTYNYPFDSLKSISKLKSSDGTMRIYTWILPSRSEGTYKYFGVVQRMNLKTHEMKLTGLVDAKSSREESELSELKYDSWYGAVYYEIIEKKVGKKKYYFLLGWQGNDRLTTRKVIDVIYFDFWDNLSFGAPLFKDENGKIKHRVIFEYSAQAVMVLRYEKKNKMIVFDHLSPSSPSAKGQFQYYGPDFTYDGLYFKKGLWQYRKNLDMRNSSGSN